MGAAEGTVWMTSGCSARIGRVPSSPVVSVSRREEVVLLRSRACKQAWKGGGGVGKPISLQPTTAIWMAR